MGVCQRGRRGSSRVALAAPGAAPPAPLSHPTRSLWTKQGEKRGEDRLIDPLANRAPTAALFGDAEREAHRLLQFLPGRSGWIRWVTRRRKGFAQDAVMCTARAPWLAGAQGLKPPAQGVRMAEPPEMAPQQGEASIKALARVLHEARTLRGPAGTWSFQHVQDST